MLPRHRRFGISVAGDKAHPGAQLRDPPYRNHQTQADIPYFTSQYSHSPVVLLVKYHEEFFQRFPQLIEFAAWFIRSACGRCPADRGAGS
jgi:hypothetical protein